MGVAASIYFKDINCFNTENPSMSAMAMFRQPILQEPFPKTPEGTKNAVSVLDQTGPIRVDSINFYSSSRTRRN
jgi:hypothetical protein